MAVLDPESLALEVKCYACLTGQRTVEAVRAYLTAQIAGNASTPNQLVALATAAGYVKLSEKQLREAIIYFLCLNSGQNCTPSSLSAASVCYQCLSWRQFDAADVYLLAQAAGDNDSIEDITSGAIEAGWQNATIWQLMAVQAYLLSIIATGSVMDKNALATAIACFQCIGAVPFRAMEIYVLFFLNNPMPPVGNFRITSDGNFRITSDGSFRVVQP